MQIIVAKQILLMSHYFAEIMPNWTSIVAFLFQDIVNLHHFITKSPRGRANHFHGKLEYSFSPIIVPKQIFLMSLYFGKILPNWPSNVHFYFRKLEFAPFYRKIIRKENKSFSWILEYSLMQIIVPKQIFLMSLYFGENLPN